VRANADADNPQFFWPPCATVQPLKRGQAHVWSHWLECSTSQAAGLAKILSEDERKRASAFRFELHRNRYISGRAALRSLLSQYLSYPADEIRFHYTSSGKPLLEQPTGTSELFFNVSHSDAVALFTFAIHGEVGVDVERIKVLNDREEIARRFFAPGEYAALSVVPNKDLAFYRCWTRKEAYLKARGVGIFGGLKDFEVSIAAEEPARLLRVRESSTEAQEWRMHELIPCEGFIGALASKTSELTVLLYHYSNPISDF
jgi:4'-phosphopantetheinyl transferase